MGKQQEFPGFGIGTTLFYKKKEEERLRIFGWLVCWQFFVHILCSAFLLHVFFRFIPRHFHKCFFASFPHPPLLIDQFRIEYHHAGDVPVVEHLKNQLIRAVAECRPEWVLALGTTFVQHHWAAVGGRGSRCRIIDR